jgi:hypothetical protein
MRLVKTHQATLSRYSVPQHLYHSAYRALVRLDLATFWLVVQRLNQLRYHVPPGNNIYELYIYYVSRRTVLHIIHD